MHRHVSKGLSYPLAGSSFKLTCPIATCPLTSSATRYIVRLLQGSRMVSHLSGSPFFTSGGFLLGCDQTGNESLVPSVWFVPF